MTRAFPGVTPAGAALLRALLDPAAASGLALAEWSGVLAAARATGTLPRLALALAEAGLTGGVPEPARRHLEAAALAALSAERRARWEIRQLRRVLSGLNCPIVLLKGAAYLALELPGARGRQYNDLDVLLPRERLDAACAALRSEGWEMAELPPHQQWYFRHWMHELPILVHRERGAMLDLHHNLLPRIDRLCFAPDALLREARPVGGDERLCALAPQDMALHGALNLFRHGDFRNGLRDLLDLDALVRTYGARPDFWPGLLARVREYGLVRPVFFALRYASRYLGTPVPAEVGPIIAAGRPAAPVLALTDRLVDLAVLPPRLDQANGLRTQVQQMLTHFPLSLWRKTILPKLQRLSGAEGSR